MTRPTLHLLRDLPTRIGRHADQAVGILLIALGLLTLYGSRNLPATAVPTDIGAGAFPIAYAAILIVLAILLILNARPVPGPEEGGTAPPNNLRVLGGGVLTLAYIGSMPFVGFPTITPIFMFALMWLLGFRRILPSLCIAAGFTAVLYLAFEVGMSVALPVGSLFE